MKATWVFLLAVGVVVADVGLGYHYKVPQTSYGVPSYQIGGNSGQYSSVYTGSLDSGSQSLSGYQSPSYQTGGVQSSTGLGSGYYQSSGVNSAVSSSGDAVPSYIYGNGALGSGYQSQSQYSSSSQYQSAEKYQQNYEIQQQPAQVFKHFYVHAAPEEPEPPKPRAPIVLPPPQKHYKIIFVKTPTENHRSQPVIPVQPQNEEKTIVYVLVKKPEDQQEVIVPKVEQKPPSKPEVYFIKYKNKEDSQAVINNIVKDYNGQQVSFLNSGAGAVGNDIPYNPSSVVSDAVYNTGSVANDVSYSPSAVVNDVSYNSASVGNDGSYAPAVYDSSAQNAVPSNSQSYGLNENQGSAYSLAAANSGVDLSEANISSTVASPVTISTTASSVDYDSASAIATSQGVPHETYGPPKFRVN